MATSPLPPGSSASLKKHSSRSKKSKHSIADSSALERRSWEAWGQREECIFFDSLVRNSRNWGAIANDIGSKRSEQVRTYYYRVLRKISRLLQAVHFNFDNRDRINTLIALLAYWEAKCETQYDETTIEFAEAIKERIVRQRQELDAMRSKRHPTPEKLTLQLVPSNETVSTMLSAVGHNPKLQLTLKSKKTMASIVEHLNTKWTAANGGVLCGQPLRLYVPDKLGHPGYGIESNDVTIVSVFHMMNCPAICRLEYNWNPDHSKLTAGVLVGHEHQELQSTSDEGSDENSSESSSRQGRSSSPAIAQRPVSHAALPTAIASNTSPSVHSPRAPAVNRLAVPDALRGHGKPLSDDALDDDAIRHGLLVRKASKLSKLGKSTGNASQYTRPNAAAAAAAIPRARSTSPPAGATTRTTRYSTRSRRAAASSGTVDMQSELGEMEEVMQDSASSAAYAMVPMPTNHGSVSSNAMQMSNYGMPQVHSLSQMQMEMPMDGSSEMSGLVETMDGHNFMTCDDELMSDSSALGDMYSSDAVNELDQLDQLEPMPSVEYGFMGGFVDTPFDAESAALLSQAVSASGAIMHQGVTSQRSAPTHGSRVSGSASSASSSSVVPNAKATAAISGSSGRQGPQAQLGVAGLPHSTPTMVVNHHYYQPTWDHSQSYFMGAAPQPPMDPYYAAYPNPTPGNSLGAPHPSTGYYSEHGYYQPYDFANQPNQGNNSSQTSQQNPPQYGGNSHSRYYPSFK